MYVTFIDWKQDAADLNRFINSVLGGMKIDNLPSVDAYPDYTTVLNERVFPEYTKALAESGITMRFLNNESDTHLVVFHAVDKAEEIMRVLDHLDIESYVFD